MITQQALILGRPNPFLTICFICRFDRLLCMTESGSLFIINFVNDYKNTEHPKLGKEKEPGDTVELGYLQFLPIENNNVVLIFKCDANELKYKNEKMSEYVLKSIDLSINLLSILPINYIIKIIAPKKLTPEQKAGLDYLANIFESKYNKMMIEDTT